MKPKFCNMVGKLYRTKTREAHMQINVGKEELDKSGKKKWVKKARGKDWVKIEFLFLSKDIFVGIVGMLVWGRWGLDMKLVFATATLTYDKIMSLTSLFFLLTHSQLIHAPKHLPPKKQESFLSLHVCVSFLSSFP